MLIIVVNESGSFSICVFLSDQNQCKDLSKGLSHCVGVAIGLLTAISTVCCFDGWKGFIIHLSLSEPRATLSWLPTRDSVLFH